MVKSSEEKNPMEAMEKHYDAVAACNRCGFCTSYCPTYNASGSEAQSPRGRNQAFRALVEGNIADPAHTKEIIDSCLLCGECTSVCFSEVPTADLMVQARNYLNQSKGIPWGLKFVLYKLLPRPKLFRFFLKLSFLGKKLGLSWILRKVGFLKRFAPSLDAADRLIKKVPLKFFLDQKETQVFQEGQQEKEQHAILVAQKNMFDLKKKGKPIPESLKREASRRPKRPKVALLAVCGSQYVTPGIGLSTLKLLQWLKVDLLIPNMLCCGLPGLSYGVLERVKYFAKENIITLEKGHFDHIVNDDSSCTAHLKDYPQYFKDDSEWFERAHSLAQKFREFPQFLIRSGMPALLATASWNKGPVAFHDPCKAQYALKTTEPPRELIRAIPGIELVEVSDSDQCCGGGGTYSFTQPDMSKQVLARKIDSIVKSGAKTVVTTSASCQIQMASGFRNISSKIEVLHLSEFLLRALEKR